jgi:3-oxoacyl-[acyl-carrier-protein] synthase-3
MQAEGLRRGLVFTCDPYSDIVDGNTELLFGDAATVTLLSDEAPRFQIGRGTWATEGACYEDLIVRDGKLQMKGERVFRFAVENVPGEIARCLQANGLSMEQIDLFLLHQGSAAIRTALMKRMGLSSERVPFEVVEYGNTVSSSIPLLLRRRLSDESARTLVLCGFGVGLSIGTITIRRSGA